jgi:hypothetical protein
MYALMAYSVSAYERLCVDLWVITLMIVVHHMRDGDA